VHPPRAVVPAYRQVADAIEEHEQLINEAEAYYARQLLTVGGEQAIRVLSASTGASAEGSTTGSVKDWKLTDELWNRLSTMNGTSPMLLSGDAAALILQAQQESVGKVQSAQGSADRFNSLQKSYRLNPALSGTELYWTTIGETLSKRPLTILDPKAGGRRHILLASPFDLGGAGSLQPLFPSEPQGDNPIAPPPNLPEEH